MNRDRQRRLQLAGAAAAAELLAWKAEVWDRLATPDILAGGEVRASAALRAVLGAAREPTASRWSVELEIRANVLRPNLVAEIEPADLGDAELTAMTEEIGVGFRDHAAPAYARELAAIAQRAGR